MEQQQASLFPDASSRGGCGNLVRRTLTTCLLSKPVFLSRSSVTVQLENRWGGILSSLFLSKHKWEAFLETSDALNSILTVSIHKTNCFALKYFRSFFFNLGVVKTACANLVHLITFKICQLFFPFSSCSTVLFLSNCCIQNSFRDFPFHVSLLIFSLRKKAAYVEYCICVYLYELMVCCLFSPMLTCI